MGGGWRGLKIIGVTSKSIHALKSQGDSVCVSRLVLLRGPRHSANSLQKSFQLCKVFVCLWLYFFFFFLDSAQISWEGLNL